MSEPEFIVTKEYRRFAEFCDACRRERYIGLCYGPPGRGQDALRAAVRAVGGLAPVLGATLLRHDFPTRPDLADCRTLFYTPTVTATPRRHRR